MQQIKGKQYKLVSGYKLVSAHYPDEFSTKINKALKDGWYFSGKLRVDKVSGLYQSASGHFNRAEFETTYSREMKKDE